VQDWAFTALTLGINGLAVSGMPIAALGNLLAGIEAIDVNLDQMKPGSDFLRSLENSPDPAIPYTVLAGNTSLIKPTTDESSNRLHRLLNKLGKGALEFPFLGQPNDIAVSVHSITKVPAGRIKQAHILNVACNHLVYFVHPEGQRALAEAVLATGISSKEEPSVKSMPKAVVAVKQQAPAQNQDGPADSAKETIPTVQSLSERDEQIGNTLDSKFSLSLAVVIGINQYSGGVPELSTAANDAKAVAALLKQEHGYEVKLLIDGEASLATINQLLKEEIPSRLKENDRLLLYFAGHGNALSGDDGPEGYLYPHDAKLGDINSLLPMAELHAALIGLPCRHFLGLLDCCFAGAFRWSSTREILVEQGRVLYQERFDRFIVDPAWQVITSAASDQTAADTFSLSGDRGHVGDNSPFAAALIEALKGHADAYPTAANGKPAGDGVITATELYMFLRDSVESSSEVDRKRQTPGIWPLKKHDKGEYIFLTPGHPLNLPPAPPPDKSKNPYRGLESFEEKDSALFFGRTEHIDSLYQFVRRQSLTVVLGASGSGKSSLVKAGLVPKLREQGEKYFVIPPFRPGKDPCNSLKLALQSSDFRNQGKETYLIVDQFEELITLCSDKDRKSFLEELKELMTVHSQTLRIVLTLRNDFESQFDDTDLKDDWLKARFVVKQMTRANLREAIEKPAEANVMYFEPHQLVEELVDEVADMPGSLPLLSFALSELYLKYLERFSKADIAGEKAIDRSLTREDYNELGGVTRSMTQRADSLYDEMVNENPAYGQIIRHVMLRMVAIGGGELARRQVPLSELEYPIEKRELAMKAIDRFTNARLLVRGKDASENEYVEPAHDALVRGWQKLLKWKREEEESLPLQRRLTPAAQEWERQTLKHDNIQHTQAFLSKRLPLLFDWLDRRLLFPLENKVSKIPKGLANRYIVPLQNRVSDITSRFNHPGLRSQNEKRGLDGKPVDYLWTTDPHLAELVTNITSNESWLNQLETEFVKRSSLQRRQNISWRWRIVASVFLGLSGLTATALWQWQSSETRRVNAEVVSQTLQADEQWKNHNQLDALVRALRAVKQVKQLKSISHANQIKAVLTLNQIVSEIKQTQILEGDSILFSTDGKKIVTGSGTRWKLWNAKGRKINESEPDLFDKQILSLSSDGNTVAYAADTGLENLSLMNLTSRKHVLVRLPKGAAKICNVIFKSHDHSISAIDANGNTIESSLQGTNIVMKGQMHLGLWPNCLALSPDGAKIAYNLSPRTIRVARLQGERIRDITADQDISNPKWAPNGISIAYRQQNGYINILNLLENNTIRLKGDAGPESFTFSADGKVLASPGKDGIVIYSLDNQEKSSVSDKNTSKVTFSPDGKTLASMSIDGSVKLWNWDRFTHGFIDHGTDLNGVVFSPDSQTITTATIDSIFSWNKSGRFRSRLILTGERLISMTASANGNQVAYIGEDVNEKRSVRLLNLDPKSNSKSNRRIGTSSASKLFFSPDSKILAIKTDIGFELYSLEENKKPIRINLGPTYDGFGFVRINGQVLFLLNSGPEIKLCNIHGECKLTIQLKGQQEINGRMRNFSLDAISVSNDGTRIATTDKNDVKLWNFKGEPIQTLRGHTAMVSSIAFMPSDEAVITGSDDNTVKVWGMDGKLIMNLPTGDGRRVQSVYISPDGKLIVAKIFSKIRTWNLDVDHLLAQGCSLAEDYLSTSDDPQLCSGVLPKEYKDMATPPGFFAQGGLSCQERDLRVHTVHPRRRKEEATCTLGAQVYHGAFKNYQFLGYDHQNKNQGLLVFRNGSYCVAPVNKGELNGIGECWLVRKQHYKGSFANGKFDGMGILTNDDGSKFQGLFKNDKPVQAVGIYQERDPETNKLVIKKGLPCKPGADNDCS
jgi:WD40 repeat protein